jgi:hypothetical protein
MGAGNLLDDPQPPWEGRRGALRVVADNWEERAREREAVTKQNTSGTGFRVVEPR